MGNFPESLSQRILVGIILVGRLGVSVRNRPRELSSVLHIPLYLLFWIPLLLHIPVLYCLRFDIPVFLLFWMISIRDCPRELSSVYDIT